MNSTVHPWRKPGWVPLALAVGFSCLVLNGRAATFTDNFGAATPVSAPVSLAAPNHQATAEPGEPAHAGEPANRSLWAKLVITNTGTYSISTSNSLDPRRLWQDTVLAVYTGSSLSNLIVLTSNDDVAPFTLWSRVIFRAYAGETFHIAVDLIGTNTGDINLQIERGGPFLPAWTGVDLQGRTISSLDYAGRVMLVDFWETTCGGCVEELPHLSALHNSFKAQGFTMIGLAIDHDQELVENYLQAHPIPYIVGMNTGTAQEVFDSTLGVPTKYLIDQDGRMVGRYIGAFSPASKAFTYYESILDLLYRPPPPRTKMMMAREGANVQISWPAADPPHRLETAFSPTAETWIPISPPMTNINGRLTITLPAPYPGQYFRLKKL